MGFTAETLDILERLPLRSKRMLEFGNQQIFIQGPLYGTPAKAYFKDRGVDHVSVDLDINHDHATQEYGCIKADLSSHLLGIGMFDIITDAGTSEHINGCGCPWPAGCTHKNDRRLPLYRARKNANDHCVAGGHMLFINPKVGHWPGHGFHYFTEEHYTSLAKLCNYSITELASIPSMGNVTDGVNVVALLKKEDHRVFVNWMTWCDLYSETIMGV